MFDKENYRIVCEECGIAFELARDITEDEVEMMAAHQRRFGNVTKLCADSGHQTHTMYLCSAKVVH